jgi:hypothetical protein
VEELAKKESSMKQAACDFSTLKMELTQLAFSGLHGIISKKIGLFSEY